MKVIHWDCHVREFINPDPDKYMVVQVNGWGHSMESETWYKQREIGTHWLVERQPHDTPYNWSVQHIVTRNSCGDPYVIEDIGFRDYHIKESPFYTSAIRPKIELPKELFEL